MPSVLGLPRLKGESHTIVTCEYTSDFVPLPGQAVSVIDGDVLPQITPFNGLFYGIACEVFLNPMHCSVVVSGLAVAVIQDPNAGAINPILPTYFNLDNGLLTNETIGVEVTARIDATNEDVSNPKTGEIYQGVGALISFDNAVSQEKQPIPPDFQKPDFLIGDFN